LTTDAPQRYRSAAMTHCRPPSSAAARALRAAVGVLTATVIVGLLGCATYQAQSLRGDACLQRCEVGSVQCFQGGGGLWATPECLPAAHECAAACPDVARVR